MIFIGKQKPSFWNNQADYNRPLVLSGDVHRKYAENAYICVLITALKYKMKPKFSFFFTNAQLQLLLYQCLLYFSKLINIARSANARYQKAYYRFP